MASMSKRPARPTDPLVETEWLLVDGTNLLFAMSRAPGAAPGSALIGRLRGAVPPSVAIDVVFDGPGERGLRNERIASGLRVRYSGPRTADAVLLSLVDETRAVDGPAATAAILVVTNDRELKGLLHARGARTAGADWLLGRLDRVGSGRAAGRRQGEAVEAGDEAAARADDTVRGRRPGRRPLGTGPRRDRQEGQPAEGAALVRARLTASTATMPM